MESNKPDKLSFYPDNSDDSDDSDDSVVVTPLDLDDMPLMPNIDGVTSKPSTALRVRTIGETSSFDNFDFLEIQQMLETFNINNDAMNKKQEEIDKLKCETNNILNLLKQK